jgi:hypothetical protein
MPSIFVWKAVDVLDTSHCSTITYHSGSNWFLEEKDGVSSSYQFQNQCELSEVGVLAYHAVKMPQNWVGGILLDTVQLPYRRIKEDATGSLEQVGCWMRYISYVDVPFEKGPLLKQWKNDTKEKPTQHNQQIMPSHSNKPYHKHTKYQPREPHVAKEECLIVFSRR